MIKDNIKNCETYYNMSKNIKKGLEWLRHNDLITMADGRYELYDGNYANIQSYTTKDDALYEAHKIYADIQYVIKGAEKIGICNYDNCTTEKPYEVERDIEFLKADNTNEDYITLKEGEFLILFPQDAHKPSLKINKNEKVKKVVVKIKI